MIAKAGTSQACAACKYQRRRCTPDCPLAPYFPSNNPKMFQNAHRLFGVCNIMKILKPLRDDQKDEAMKSIIYEADMRERYPAYGCTWVIYRLREQIRQCEEELYRINSLLAKFTSKEHENNFDLFQNNNYQQYNYQIDANNMHLVYDQGDFTGDKEVTNYVDSSDHMVVKPALKTHNYYCNTFINKCSVGLRSNFMVPQEFPFQQEFEVLHNYGDHMGFDILPDDRQSHVESYEACESSAESTLKGSKDHDLELQCAATQFRLTNME